MIRKTGSWRAVEQLLAKAPKRVSAAIDSALLEDAQFFRKKIVEGIREQAPGGQAFHPLAPTTLAVRRFRGFKGSKALIVGGDLRNSITVTRVGNKVFVGVLRTARGKAGQPLVNVAAVHEYGSRPIVMKLTPKALRFLHAVFRKAGLDERARRGPSTGIAILRVPARPFMGPVYDKYGADREAVSRRFLERVARKLSGDFGRSGT
jgi:phage gpG-like protein